MKNLIIAFIFFTFITLLVLSTKNILLIYFVGLILIKLLTSKIFENE